MLYHSQVANGECEYEEGEVTEEEDKLKNKKRDDKGVCTSVHMFNMLVQSQSTWQDSVKDKTYEHGHTGTPHPVHLLFFPKVAFGLSQSFLFDGSESCPPFTTDEHLIERLATTTNCYVGFLWTVLRPPMCPILKMSTKIEPGLPVLPSLVCEAIVEAYS